MGASPVRRNLEDRFGSGETTQEEGIESERLGTSALRRRFPEAFAPSPAIYWADMLGSATLGWGAFALGLAAARGSALQLLALVVAVLALYRGVLFIHELAHLRRGAVPGFETAWNLLVGLPFLAPSLLYVGSHADHHRRSVFGTRSDPEYEPIAHWSRLRIAASFPTMLVVPIALALRWGVLGPLSRAFPPLRGPVLERLSTLVINPTYRRSAPRGRDALRWAVEEAGAALVVWAVVAGLLAGALPVAALLQWYGVMSAILLLNHARTLAAHRYENLGAPLDGVGQLLDSVNLRGAGAAALIAPVGLRFHALHHLAPAIPYHQLGWVHRRLLAELPANAPYRAAELRGVLAGIRGLFARARQNRRAALVGGKQAA